MNRKTNSKFTLAMSILLILLSSYVIFGQKTSNNNLITKKSVGDVKLGMTIGEARKALKGFTLGEGGGSEGLTFIGVFDGKKQILEFGQYGERNDKGELPAIDENQVIKYISILDSRYKTEEGVGIGTKVEEAEKRYGKLKEIFFDQHVGEIAYFSKAPKGLGFLLIGNDGKYGKAGNYVGAKPQDYGQRTKKYVPGAYISSMSINIPPPAQEVVSITDTPKHLKVQIYGPKKCDDDSGETRYSLWTTRQSITYYQEFMFKGLKMCLEDGAESEDISVTYKDQYDVNFGDYNFDGDMDLALRDGMDGGYGSATYQVYLFSKAKGKYVHNPLMTKLAQYQGMFQVDKKKKMLFNYSKSGCCWHQVEGYSVINNEPVKVYEKTDDQMNGKLKVTIKKLINGKWKTIKSPSIK